MDSLRLKQRSEIMSRVEKKIRQLILKYCSYEDLLGISVYVQNLIWQKQTQDDIDEHERS